MLVYLELELANRSVKLSLHNQQGTLLQVLLFREKWLSSVK